MSDVQFSRFAETEVAKLLTFGRPRGMLEVMIPMTDDERRDLETHIKEHFLVSLALQVKACEELYRHGRAYRLQKRFTVSRQHGPGANDRFHRYACEPAELAGRVVEVLRAEEGKRRTALKASRGSIILPAGTILVGRAA